MYANRVNVDGPSVICKFTNYSKYMLDKSGLDELESVYKEKKPFYIQSNHTVIGNACDRINKLR